MTRSRFLLLAFAVAFCLTGAGTAAAFHTSFVVDTCHWDDPIPMASFTRDGSTTVALRARHEGYQWGGG